MQIYPTLFMRSAAIVVFIFVSACGEKNEQVETAADITAAGPAPLNASTDSENGARIFTKLCAPCHGKGPGIDGSDMLPGSAALAAKYKGAVSAFLEDRGEVDAETLRYFVRNGAGAMPGFRKTEITDEEIADIAAYLAAQGAEPDKM